MEEVTRHCGSPSAVSHLLEEEGSMLRAALRRDPFPRDEGAPTKSLQEAHSLLNNRKLGQEGDAPIPLKMPAALRETQSQRPQEAMPTFFIFIYFSTEG